MKALLQSLRADGGRGETSPPEQEGSSHCEDDAISVAASGTLFREAFLELGSQTSGSGSGASQGGAGEPVSAAIKTALSPEYVQELHACWIDTLAFSRQTAHGRALAAMHEMPKFGLGCMPPIESAIASLIVPPDEALKPNARCPRPQCRKLTLPSHVGPLLFFGVGSLCQSTQGLLDASLQAFALMTRELGRTLSMLVHARRQVWLAQSYLAKPCRRIQRVLPVVSGELCGFTTLEALEHLAQASRTRQHLAGLHRPHCQPVAAGAAGGSLRGSFPPPVPFLGSTSMAPTPRPARAQGDHGGA
ncbi:hypothetical protein GOODEAATRI_016385 [Goodea atripinnis]|uniref:Uncharacterized protein n=1 Tax=Goodea atripinnis TaxID=208336 RepID=A0ABV0MKA2_9TELE